MHLIVTLNQLGLLISPNCGTVVYRIFLQVIITVPGLYTWGMLPHTRA